MIGGKRPLNEFMKIKEKARKAGEAGFEYTSKDGVVKRYKFKKTKTGMLVPKEVNKKGKFIDKSKEKAAAKKRKQERKARKKEKAAAKKE
jgi:hypothetical protein